MSQAGLMGAAGASQGLEELLARRLIREKFEEEKRGNLATEGYRNKALEEQTGLRKATMENTAENQAANLELRKISQAQLAGNQASLNQDRDAARAQQLTLAQLAAGRQGESAATAAGAREDTRNDRSYNYSATALDALRKPVADSAERLGRLVDTINENSPQADSLVAPELLTAMAGGQGSGLRMNEAEISRIVGGRTNWESLKAAVNKWQLDPAKGLSITPSQRQQIRSLIAARHSRISKQLSITDKAKQDLIAAKDPTSHRQIVSKAQKDLDAINTGEGTDTGSGTGDSAHPPLQKFGATYNWDGTKYVRQ